MGFLPSDVEDYFKLYSLSNIKKTEEDRRKFDAIKNKYKGIKSDVFSEPDFRTMKYLNNQDGKVLFYNYNDLYVLDLKTMIIKKIFNGYGELVMHNKNFMCFKDENNIVSFVNYNLEELYILKLYRGNYKNSEYEFLFNSLILCTTKTKDVINKTYETEYVVINPYNKQVIKGEEIEIGKNNDIFITFNGEKKHFLYENNDLFPINYSIYINNSNLKIINDGYRDKVIYKDKVYILPSTITMVLSEISCNDNVYLPMISFNNKLIIRDLNNNRDVVNMPLDKKEFFCDFKNNLVITKNDGLHIIYKINENSSFNNDDNCNSVINVCNLVAEPEILAEDLCLVSYSTVFKNGEIGNKKFIMIDSTNCKNGDLSYKETDISSIYMNIKNQSNIIIKQFKTNSIIVLIMENDKIIEKEIFYDGNEENINEFVVKEETKFKNESYVKVFNQKSNIEEYYKEIYSDDGKKFLDFVLLDEYTIVYNNKDGNFFESVSCNKKKQKKFLWIIKIDKNMYIVQDIESKKYYVINDKLERISELDIKKNNGEEILVYNNERMPINDENLRKVAVYDVIEKLNSLEQLMSLSLNDINFDVPLIRELEEKGLTTIKDLIDMEKHKNFIYNIDNKVFLDDLYSYIHELVDEFNKKDVLVRERKK